MRIFNRVSLKAVPNPPQALDCVQLAAALMPAARCDMDRPEPTCMIETAAGVSAIHCRPFC